MIDPFVLLAPVLLLAVIALLRFTGCFIKPSPPSPPAPTITGFDPPDATAGDLAFELTVNGSNFRPGLTVTFGNTPVSVNTPVTPNQIKVQIPTTAPELASPGQVPVTVTNPDAQTASATYQICRRVAVTFAALPTGAVTGIISPVDPNIDFGTNQWSAEGAVLPEDPNAHIFFASGTGPACPARRTGCPTPRPASMGHCARDKVLACRSTRTEAEMNLVSVPSL